MKLIRLLIIIFLFGADANVKASDEPGWASAGINSITSFISGCIKVPKFTNVDTSSTNLELEQSGQWIPTGTIVQRDKLLQFEWSTEKLSTTPRKYKVLYRVDPRFSNPQLFIQEKRLIQKENGDSEIKYISDFHQFKNGQLLRYQDSPEMTFLTRIQDYTDYFNFIGRSKIPVKKDDVVNITIDNEGNYFGSNSEMTSELGFGDELSMIYTQSPIENNRIIYSDAQIWCDDIIKPSNPEYATYCSNPGTYWDLNENTKTLTGKIDNNAFNINKFSIQPCADSANDKNNNPVCYYDKGRGLTLSVGGTTIKSTTQSFIHSDFTDKDFFYYKSDIDGYLDIKSDWPISGMYNDSGMLNHFMANWLSLGGNDYSSFKSLFVPLKNDFTMNFLHFGRYLLDIEIGNANAAITESDLNKIQIEYKIMEAGQTPTTSSSGISIPQNFRGNASDSGDLWIRVIGPNDNSITGSVVIKTMNYTGITWFSDVIYNGLIKPLRSKFNELSEVIYTKLVSNAALQNIARSMLVIYVIIYGLMFLSGMAKITVSDIVTRVLKIGVIVALFSETSWTFFSKNLFNVFIDGTDYLLTSLVGVTSSVGNIFGFIDPIIDKYTNAQIWGLLFIQLLQIHTGLTFFALITIYAILTYFRGMLEVIVSYCLAFLGLAIMVSLAPLFIILLLFERTKTIFNNWLSVMFSYMMQPTILLIFFLLIDQIISEQITQTVVESCWDILIPIKIGLDLKNMGIPINFSFTLPFLPGIPFYVPEVASIDSIEDFFSKPGTFTKIATSSLLFFTLCKLAQGLVNYASLVVQYLTNVLAARRYGRLHEASNTVKSITNDIGKLASPITGTFRGVGNFAKEKFIDQKITHRPNNQLKDIDYSKVHRQENLGNVNNIPEGSEIEDSGNLSGRSGEIKNPKEIPNSERIQNSNNIKTSEKTQRERKVQSNREIPTSEKIEDTRKVQSNREIPTSEKIEDIREVQSNREIPTSEKIEDIREVQSNREIPTSEKIEDIREVQSNREIPTSEKIEDTRKVQSNREIRNSGKIDDSE